MNTVNEIVLAQDPATISDAKHIAMNLARNCGYSVFPCLGNKAPACPAGFKAASREPDVIADLWDRYPGVLIGVATGRTSGISVLDIDGGDWDELADPKIIQRHESARAWWQSNAQWVPPTRTFRSVSGGLHLHYLHHEGVQSTVDRIALGIDTRGQGGYIIYWFAAGLECLDHSPPVPWPTWTIRLLQPKRHPAPMRRRPFRSATLRSVTDILRSVERAPPGQRNSSLFLNSCRLGRLVKLGEINASEAEWLLVKAGTASGLPTREAHRTARSGLQRTEA